MRLHTDGTVVGLMKKVPFCWVVVSQVFSKLQHVPKPLAQLPEAAPPLLEHSLLVKQVPWLPELVVHSELGNWIT